MLHELNHTTPPPDNNIIETEENLSSTNIQTHPFELSDAKGNHYEIYFEHDTIRFDSQTPPIVMLHFFSTQSVPCRGEAPYLSILQQRYKEKILIIGILLHPDTQLETLDRFIEENQASYFISSSSNNDRFATKVTHSLGFSETIPIPLSILYLDGNYTRHYEGAIPIEMLEHDIQTLLKKGDN